MADDKKSLDPEQAKFIAKARRLMLIASLTTVIALGAVFAVIGYRVSHPQGSAQPVGPGTVPPAGLPAGAKVLSTAVGDGHIIVTVETGGAVELLSFDLATLKPLGRLRLNPAP